MDKIPLKISSWGSQASSNNREPDSLLTESRVPSVTVLDNGELVMYVSDGSGNSIPVSSRNISFGYDITGLDITIPSKGSGNIFDVLTNSNLTFSSGKPSSFLDINNGVMKISTDYNNSVVDYIIRVLFSGTISGVENSPREFSVTLKRFDDTTVLEDTRLKEENNNLDKFLFVFPTLTTDNNDEFIVNGFKLIASNNSDVSVNITGINLYITGTIHPKIAVPLP